jgi:N-acetylmuramoyl-L-alanine amidase
VRSALLSILILTAAAVASLGTRAQSNQPASAASAAPQQKPAAPAAPAVTSPAQAAPATPAKPSSVPAELTVVLDPAHGGSDTGARGPTGAAESDIVLDFARAMRVSMEAKGLRVLFTREGNQDPSFDDRSALVNSMRNVVFISLHVSSTGPIGTVRAYSYQFPSAGPSPEAAAGLASNQGSPEAAPPPAPSHPGLVEWDKAQRSYLGMSQQLASLVQIQLAQKFNGSPEVPLAAGVRQLRSIAAPAIAIEVSSVAVTDPHQLAVMGQPLADAVARAVADFRSAADGVAAADASGGAH